MKKATGEAPVLLLDDVMSELDDRRQQLLLSAIGGYQTVLTCTHLGGNLMKKGTVYSVRNGTVSSR